MKTEITTALSIFFCTLVGAGCSTPKAQTQPTQPQPTATVQQAQRPEPEPEPKPDPGPTLPPEAEGVSPAGKQLLKRVLQARSARQATQRVVEYAEWTTQDSLRVNADNYGIIQATISANPHLANSERVTEYFFDLTNLFARNCTRDAHEKMMERLRDMRAVAEACGKAGLAAALEERITLHEKFARELQNQRLCQQASR